MGYIYDRVFAGQTPEEQEMVIYDPDGNEAKRIDWEGRTV